MLHIQHKESNFLGDYPMLRQVEPRGKEFVGSVMPNSTCFNIILKGSHLMKGILPWSYFMHSDYCFIYKQLSVKSAVHIHLFPSLQMLIAGLQDLWESKVAPPIACVLRHREPTNVGD